jgi:ribosomal protein S8
MRDVVSDMITRIRNGQKANLLEVPLFFPTPKICINILKILEDEGFIRGFTKKIINERIHLVVLLKYDN